MSGLVKNLTNVQSGGGDNGYGLPNLPGLNDGYGTRDEIPRGPFTNNSRYFPSEAAAAADYAQHRQVGEIPVNPETGAVGRSPVGDSPAPNIHRPSFADAIRQGGANIQNQGLSRSGKLMAVLGQVAQGALVGSAGRSFGQGALLENQNAAQQEERRLNAVEHAREVARQQQQDALNARNVNSEIDYRKAQMNQKSEPSQHVVGGSLVDSTGRVIYQAPAKPDTNNTPYEDFRKGYPDTAAGRLRAAQEYINKTRPPKDGGPSKGQVVASQRHYEQRLDELAREKNSATSLMSDQEFAQRKAQIDADYQNELDTLGASRPKAGAGNGAPPRGAKIRDYTQLQ